MAFQTSAFQDDAFQHITASESITETITADLVQTGVLTHRPSITESIQADIQFGQLSPPVVPITVALPAVNLKEWSVLIHPSQDTTVRITDAAQDITVVLW